MFSGQEEVFNYSLPFCGFRVKSFQKETYKRAVRTLDLFLTNLLEKCGGNFKYNEKGFKDCTNCQLPHKKKNYGYVTGKYQELAAMMQKVREADHKNENE